MKPRTTIYIGGPDRNLLSLAIYREAAAAGLLPERRPPPGRRAKDLRSWVVVQCDALAAWVVTVRAQLEMAGAVAYCKIEETARA